MKGSGAKFSMEGKKNSAHDKGTTRNTHWSENALQSVERAGRVAGAIGTAWQIGRGAVQAGRMLAPLLAVA